MSEASKAAWMQKVAEGFLEHMGWSCSDDECTEKETAALVEIIERHYRAAQPPTDPREAFENAMRAIVADDPLDFTPCPNESCGKWFHYLSRTTAWAFEAWKARAAQPETDPNAKCGLCGDIVSNHVCPNRAAQPTDILRAKLTALSFLLTGNDAAWEHNTAKQMVDEYTSNVAAQPESTPPPFGWWDTFNEHLWRTETDAAKAIEGGNNVIALYAGAAQTPGETCPSNCNNGLVKLSFGWGRCRDPWHSPAPAPQTRPCIFDPAAEGICNKPGHPHHEPAPQTEKP